MAVELLSFLADELHAFAAVGKPVLGVCNGFQVLVRTGLLPFGTLGAPGATLTTNASGRFECRWVRMRVEDGVLSGALPALIRLPSAHAEGRFYAEEETLRRIEADGHVALRYVDDTGEPTSAYPANPNGSVHAIAGLRDATGRVLGLMPHPERFVSSHQLRGAAAPNRAEPDGVALIRGGVALA
jgi:phosphoribosylformylglycinamidine synthase